MKGALPYVAATVVGLGLFVMPFLRYGLGGGHSHAAGPHSDHGARHGGHLVMLHDYHLELVEQQDAVELYLSDAFPMAHASSRPAATERSASGIPFLARPDSARRSTAPRSAPSWSRG